MTEIAASDQKVDSWRDEVSERKAKKIIEDYSKLTIQEPVATFYSDSESEMDLDQLKTGTILRVEHRDTIHPKGLQYRWFVIGDRAEDPDLRLGRIFAYDVSLPRLADNSPQLPPTDKATVFARSPIRVRSFSPIDALLVLEDHEDHVNTNRFREAYPVLKVDVMGSGANANLGSSKAEEKVDV